MKPSLLRSALLCLVFVASFSAANAQWVTIPDPNFVTWLNANGFSQCMNGNQMDTTCQAIVDTPYVYCSHANISDLTGIQYFDSLKDLYCHNNLLTTLPPLPKNLWVLFCHDNSLTGLPALPKTIVWLYCQFNDITSLPALPDSLREFDCSHNNLTSLPSIPPLTYWVTCNNNQLTSIPPLPPSVNSLMCDANQLTGLPAFQPTFVSLSCNRNQITAFPPFPASLEHLNCSENLLDSLPALPNGLKSLWVGNNLMTTLPDLPDSLNSLHTNGTPLVALPALPDNLEFLQVEGNQLTRLPALPPRLTSFACNYNYIDSLPALPPNLRGLGCGHNQLTVLPAIPPDVKVIYCPENHLTSLPPLPDSLTSIIFSDNPIACMPHLNWIWNLEFLNTNITCVSNYGTVMESNPPLSFVPLCDTFNSNGCDILWNISGNTFFDDNSDCAKDTGDIIVRNVGIKLWSGGNLVSTTYIGGEGFYSFDTDSFGTYTITVDTSNIPFYVTCPDSGTRTSNLAALDSAAYGKDFGLECKPAFDLTAWSIYTDRFRPANFTQVGISAGDITNFYGVHCAAGVSGTVTVTIIGPAAYYSPAFGARTPGVSGNVLNYSIADFGAVDFNSDFNFILHTDTTAALGSLVCITVYVTPTAGDIDTTNNILTNCYIVVGSYDPNDKQVYPAGNIDTLQEWLTYTIRFQNTGTAEAQHIFITDTLDADLDASTFQLLAYSHQPQVQLKENAVRFNFSNINLPDSFTNEPGSHGYVQYKIKIKPGKPLGTQIENTAFIYFDFNAPVVTNTTTSTICVSSQSSMSASICNGEVFDFFGNSLNTAGNYSHKLANGIGCDSIINLTLAFEDHVTSTLQVTIVSGTSYNFNGAILTTAGSYTDTLNTISGCDSIVNLELDVISGISKTRDELAVSLFPNPASDFVIIRISESIKGAQATVTDALGRTVASVQLLAKEQRLITSSFAKGVYFISVQNGNGNKTIKKLVVE